MVALEARLDAQIVTASSLTDVSRYGAKPHKVIVAVRPFVVDEQPACVAVLRRLKVGPRALASNLAGGQQAVRAVLLQRRD